MNDSDVEQLLAYASEQIPDAKVKDVSSAYEDETYYPVLGFEFEPIRFRYLALTRELWGQKSTIDELTRHMECSAGDDQDPRVSDEATSENRF